MYIVYVCGIVCVCMYLYARVLVVMHVWRPEGMPVVCSMTPSYSLEAESLTEPGDPRNPPSAASLGTFPLTL